MPGGAPGDKHHRYQQDYAPRWWMVVVRRVLGGVVGLSGTLVRPLLVQMESVHTGRLWWILAHGGGCEARSCDEVSDIDGGAPHGEHG
jgi:hypothetical protein